MYAKPKRQKTAESTMMCQTEKYLKPLTSVKQKTEEKYYNYRKILDTLIHFWTYTK